MAVTVTLEKFLGCDSAMPKNVVKYKFRTLAEFDPFQESGQWRREFDICHPLLVLEHGELLGAKPLEGVWYPSGSIDKCFRKVKRLNSCAISTEKRRLARPASRYFQVDEFQFLGQGLAILLRPAATIVTYDKRNTSRVQFAQGLFELLATNRAKVPGIALATHSLIGRIHVDNIFRMRLPERFGVVACVQLCLAAQEP
jgi:hypothetical protein